jgi:uncharacterized protein YndB with AHSA1/START domain
MTNGFRLTTTLPAAPAAVYRAWLSSREHSAMTGGAATASASVGGHFTAWDGYISGRNVALKAPSHIVQTWRTTQFSASDPDSRLELSIRPSGKGGSELVLIHSGIPPEQVAGYRSGWVEHYFVPMKAYFASLRPARKPARKTTPRKKAKKKAAARRRPAKKKTVKRRKRAARRR